MLFDLHCSNGAWQRGPRDSRALSRGIIQWLWLSMFSELASTRQQIDRGIPLWIFSIGLQGVCFPLPMKEPAKQAISDHDWWLKNSYLLYDRSCNATPARSANCCIYCCKWSQGTWKFKIHWFKLWELNSIERKETTFTHSELPEETNVKFAEFPSLFPSLQKLEEIRFHQCGSKEEIQIKYQNKLSCGWKQFDFHERSPGRILVQRWQKCIKNKFVRRRTQYKMKIFTSIENLSGWIYFVLWAKWSTCTQILVTIHLLYFWMNDKKLKFNKKFVHFLNAKSSLATLNS